MTQHNQAERQRVTRACFGTTRDLEAALDVPIYHLRTWEGPRREKHKVWVEQEKRRLSAAGQQTDFADEQLYNFVAKARPFLVVREKATGDIIVKQGDVKEILESVGSREIIAAGVSFEGRSAGVGDGPSLGSGRLTFAKDMTPARPHGRAGVELVLTSPAPALSAEIANAVYSELVEHRPWWHLLRTKPSQWISALTSTAVMFSLTFVLLEPVDLLSRLVVSALFGTAGLLLLINRLFDLLLPSFEVRDSGRSTGGRNIATVLSLVVLATVIGVFSNRLA